MRRPTPTHCLTIWNGNIRTMGNTSTDSTNASGIKVLDRAVSIMLTVAEHPMSLSELCQCTGLPRATAHRLASALEAHSILTRTSEGKWAVGAVLASLGASTQTRMIDAATPIMSELMQATNESVQLYQLAGTTRVCIAAQEPAAGLQNTVPVGTRLPLNAGSAAKIFLAHAAVSLRNSVLTEGAKFSQRDLDAVLERGWADSTSEREVGLASVSAPVFDGEGRLAAVLSVSGPSERMRPNPGQRWASQLQEAAARLTGRLTGAPEHDGSEEPEEDLDA